MDEDWYYGIGDDTLGPVRFEELLAVLRRQPDWRDVPVWCSDFTDWRQASDVHQIVFQLGRSASAPAAPQMRPKQQSSMPDKAAPEIAPKAAPKAIPMESLAAGNDGDQARRKQLMLIGAGVGALIVVAATAVFVFQPFTPPLDRAIARVIQETKPALPKKADEATSLTDVARSGSKLVYNHVWDGPRFAIPANLGALMKQRKLADICSAAEEIFAHGGSVEYSYRSQSSLFIASFEVRKEDCA